MKAKPVKAKTKVIKLIPTDFEVIVIVTSDFEELEKILSNYVGDNAKEILSSVTGNMDGFSIDWETDKEKKYLMCLHSFNPATIAHECIHTTWLLSRDVGFNFAQDEELQAYYVGYITDEVLKMSK